jgi:hypothetical protein
MQPSRAIAEQARIQELKIAARSTHALAIQAGD